MNPNKQPKTICAENERTNVKRSPAKAMQKMDAIITSGIDIFFNIFQKFYVLLLQEEAKFLFLLL